MPLIPGLTLALKPSVRLLQEPPGLEEPGLRRVRLTGAGAGSRTLLEALALGGQSEEALCQAEDPAEARERRYLLALLERGGWLRLSLPQEGRPRATLEPLSGDFRLRMATGPGPWRLSRFAWVRRLGSGTAVLESALGSGRILLHDPEMVALVGRLCLPRTLEELAGTAGLTPTLAAAWMSLLLSTAAAAPCAPTGELPEDRDAALRQWEFHDLLFHSRSRPGRHGEPVGGTFRFLGELPSLPALKAPAARRIPLPEPRLPEPEAAFFAVLEARRSLRGPGREAMTLQQLGSFLHHVARVRAVTPGQAFESVSAPCPGAGALHELELYLTVSRCEGLAPGFYHYAAGAHALEPCPAGGLAASELLRQAQAAMASAQPPDILFTLAARIQRVTWKYQSIAYALILKDAGVLYQQMYLVATALGLAPCALGAGDIQVFAEASGLPFTQETSVGEFALSGSAGPLPEAAASGVEGEKRPRGERGEGKKR